MWIPVPTRAVLLAVGLALSACEKTSQTTQPTEPNTVTAAGGTVSFDGGAVRLDIPPGAVSAPVTFTATALPPDDDDLASPGYRIGPNVDFAEPITVRVRVDRAAIDGIAEAEHVGAAVRLDDGWIGIPGAYDPADDSISFLVGAIGEVEVVEPVEAVERRGGRATSVVVGFAGGGSVSCIGRRGIPSGSSFATLVPKYVTADGSGSDLLDGTNTRPWATLSNSVARLRRGQRLVVRSGGEFVNDPLSPPGLGVETFPIHLPPSIVVEGEGATVRIQPHPTAIDPDALFRVSSSPNYALVTGLTIESERMPNPPAGDLDRDRIAIVTAGAPVFDGITSRTTSGYEIRQTSPNPRMLISRGSLTQDAARIDMLDGALTLYSTTFQNPTRFNNAPTAAVHVRAGAACAEAVTVQGGEIGIQGRGTANVVATDCTFQGTDIGVLLGDLAAPSVSSLQYAVSSNTFQGCRRAGVVHATARTATDLVRNDFANDPPLLWYGPPPFLEPVDIAFVNEPFGHPRWWSLNRAEPSTRFGAQTGFDHATGVFILFGGVSGGVALDDTWSFDTRSFAWTELTPASIPPEPRFEHMMATVPSTYRTTNNVFMVGGHRGGGADILWPMDEIWVYESTTNDWTMLTATGAPPTPRYAATWIAAEESDSIYLYGGIDAGGNFLNDMWRYDVSDNEWTPISPVGGTTPRAYHGGAAYPGGIVYYGGMTYPGGPPTGDMYTVEGGVTIRAVTQSFFGRPEARLFHSFGRVHDEAGLPRFVTFGGSAPDGSAFTGDAHVFHVDGGGAGWDSGSWEPIRRPFSSITPEARGRATMIQWIEPSRPNDNILVFGGTNDAGQTIGSSYIYMAGGSR